MSIVEEKNLTIIRKNGTIPSVPFLLIKEKLLGKSYDLTYNLLLLVSTTLPAIQ